jgi:hypothetical protein
MSDQQPFLIADIEDGEVVGPDLYFPSEKGFSVSSFSQVSFTLILKSIRYMVQESGDGVGWVGVAVRFDEYNFVIPTSGWIATSGEATRALSLVCMAPRIRLRVQFLTGDNRLKATAKRSL